MGCTGNIIVECEKCATKQSFSCDDFDDWNEVSEDQGAAGKEIQLEGSITGECDICKKEIIITASIWDYPDAPSHPRDCFDIDNVGTLVSHDCNCS